MTWHGKTQPLKVALSDEKYSLLLELAEYDDYWESTLKFYEDIKDRPLESLTPRQKDWFEDIEDSLTGELNKRSARGVFGELM